MPVWLHQAGLCFRFHSLVETAKANDLEPCAYLRLVSTQLPGAQTVEDIEALLPGRFDPAIMNPQPHTTLA